jgi:hypothetical protein
MVKNIRFIVELTQNLTFKIFIFRHRKRVRSEPRNGEKKLGMILKSVINLRRNRQNTMMLTDRECLKIQRDLKNFARKQQSEQEGLE